MNDGELAFPQQMTVNNGRVDFPYEYGVGGMTLRDYFAAKALSGMLAYPGNEITGNCHNNATPEQVAERAYWFADAMISAREQKPE